MKHSFLLVIIVSTLSCNQTIKLSVPAAFREQATEYHVKGSKKNKMELSGFTISKIKRGLHMSYPGWSRGFFLENLLLNEIGLQKTEHVKKEKANFRFSLSDGKYIADIFGKEREMTRSMEYELTKKNRIFNSFEFTKEYRYIFSTLIKAGTSSGDKTWELLMTNIYERENSQNNDIFTIIKPDDNGVAVCGQDSLFIKGITIRETESAKGKTGKLPIKILGGYEVRTSDGVAAIIDIIGSNIWFYNELESEDRLVISAIAAAIFARRVNNATW